MKHLNFSYTHTNLSSAKTTRHCWPNFGYRLWLNVWTKHGSAGAAWAPVAGGASLRANPDALPPRRGALSSAGAPCPRPAGRAALAPRQRAAGELTSRDAPAHA